MVFTADSPFSIKTANGAKNWDGTLYYSNEYYSDNSMWSVWNGKDEIFSDKENGGKKERVYIRGMGNTYLTGGTNDSISHVDRGLTVSFEDATSLATCNGPISSILQYTAKEDSIHIAYPDQLPNYTEYGFRVASWGFSGLFCRAGCRIYSAPRINVCGIDCSFHSMFTNNTNLRIAPLIEDVDTRNLGFHWFLENCQNLETVPYILRTEDYNDPYHSFFYACTSAKFKSDSPSNDCPNFFMKIGNNIQDAFSYTYYWPNSRQNAVAGTKYYTNLKVIKRPEWPVY